MSDYDHSLAKEDARNEILKADDIEFARETLGPDATDNDVRDLANQRLDNRQGADPFGRSDEDWARHAE